MSHNAIYYGVDHKIKHLACQRDFFVHEIPCIKHMQNVPYPSIPGYLAYVLYREFHAQKISVTSKMLYCHDTVYYSHDFDVLLP